MPTYVYGCDTCGLEFEKMQRFQDPRVDTCPRCGAKVRRILQPAGIVFKGSGWHSTDYKGSRANGNKESAGETTSDKGSGGADSSTKESADKGSSDKNAPDKAPVAAESKSSKSDSSAASTTSS